MPVRRAKRPRPMWVVDADGEALGVAGQCGLFIDMAQDDEPPVAGDWVATEAGSRYFIYDAHVVRRRGHSNNLVRYQLRTLRLPKHAAPPGDVRVVWLSWYPRGRRVTPSTQEA